MARLRRTTSTHPGSFQLAGKPPRGFVIGGAARRVSSPGPQPPVIGGSARAITNKGHMASHSAGSRQVEPGKAGGKGKG